MDGLSFVAGFILGYIFSLLAAFTLAVKVAERFSPRPPAAEPPAPPPGPIATVLPGRVFEKAEPPPELADPRPLPGEAKVTLYGRPFRVHSFGKHGWTEVNLLGLFAGMLKVRAVDPPHAVGHVKMEQIHEDDRTRVGRDAWSVAARDRPDAVVDDG